VIPIDVASDPRLADYVDLTDPDLRKRTEAERGFFIAESPHVVVRLLASGRAVRSVLVTPEQWHVMHDLLAPLTVPVFVAPPAILRRVVGFDLHRGVVAAADRWPLPTLADVVRGARRIVVCEGINDHENLGVLFRSAAALGMDAVLVDEECADPWYRRCVRVSIGHVITLPWTRIGDLGEVHGAGFTTVACTPAPGARALDTIEWPERTALLFGAEGPGLSAAWLSSAGIRARIPMHAGADSLNVATAAALFMWESRLRPTPGGPS
jgi:tRNA G18 (ribose-2'-O)-methylase SpoU